MKVSSETKVVVTVEMSLREAAVLDTMLPNLPSVEDTMMATGGDRDICTEWLRIVREISEGAT